MMFGGTRAFVTTANEGLGRVTATALSDRGAL